MIEAVKYIGKIINVKIDRPINSLHPKYGFKYNVNYGYVPNTVSGDNEELDVYILGVLEPISEFQGKCIAVIHRTNDNDDKLIVAPDGLNFSDEEIEHFTAFQEKWFKHIIIRNPNVTKTHFGVYGVCKKENKMLVIKKLQGPYSGLFDLPEAYPEKDETFEYTIQRELKEKANLDLIDIKNKKQYSIIFSDFTKQSNEKGTLQHNAVLFDVSIKDNLSKFNDNYDSLGTLWVDTDTLDETNATPYALIGAGKNLINVANENDEIISTHIRANPLPDNRYIMISAVMLYTLENKIVIQQIASHKKWAGLWTYSAAGHVDAGESYIQAAKRELQEELGISADIEKEISALDVYRDGKKIAYHHVFKAHSDNPIIPDKSEIAQVKIVSKEELKQMAKDNPEQIFPELLELINSNKI